MSAPIKRFSLSLLTVVFVAVVVFGSMSFVQPAQAMPVEITADLTKVADKVEMTIDQMIKTAVLNASLQAMSYFTRKFAYDSAVWLASGGKGQSAFAHTSSFGDYISKTADAAVGAGIDALGAPFGLNLCHIPDVRLDLTLRLSLPNRYGIPTPGSTGEYPPKPNCSFSDFTKNWTMSNFNSMYGADNIADRFNASFQTDQSDLGIYLGATAKIDQLRAQEVYNKQQQRTEDQGAIGFTDLISGNIKTPGQVMMGEIKSQSPSEGKKVSDEQINSAFSAGVYQILPSTLGVFLNTLASQMLTNYQTKGMFPFGIGYGEGGGSAANYTAQGGGQLTGRRLAEEMFSEYKIASINSVSDYNILAHFKACPDNPAPDNCVANDDLVNALQEAQYGDPITIAEALQKKLLPGTWKLISPLRVAENQKADCFENAFCYRNVQMLRKARILPLGFEIATYLSDPDKPWTLQDVVNGYDKCDPIKDPSGKITGYNYDPIGHPFCHLIDPNWILRVPDTKCNAMAVGPSLVSAGLPNRQQECVDFSSCVQYDGNKCVAYGYCTKEHNVSKFSADTCDAQNNSCQTFTSQTSGAQASYLYRTLDTGSCNDSNVGCRAYSLSQSDGQWQYPSVSDHDVDNANDPYNQVTANINKGIFLNKNVTTNCSANSLGCTAFNLAENSTQPPLYLREAPDYLKCYDKTPFTAKIDWPQTESDLALLRPRSDCANYAKPCIPDEVSCNWYTPVDNSGNTLDSEKIPGRYTPGLVPAGDECDPKCVGYDAYRELASNYSVGQDLAYIIPKSGNTCLPAEVGCSGFTNLSTTAGGLEQVDYYSFLRSCISPDPTKQKTFYTYEGSGTNGYQLIVYNLEEDKIGVADPTSQKGGPQYSYKTDSELANDKTLCNEALYRANGVSPDCKQFNDANGHVFYRLLSQTIVVSDQCTPYRLNETALVTADGIIGDKACTAAKGLWQNGVCQVCLQNGEYRKEDGHCYYYGLPAGVKLSAGLVESTSCSASAASCREYKGSRANNLSVKLFADFDASDADLTNWSAKDGTGSVVLSAESTHLGQHSLMYNATQALGEVHRNNLNLTTGDSYEISFWAKGDTGLLTVNLVNDAPPTGLGSVSVTNVWRNYKIGTDKILAGTSSNATLSFRVASTGHLFLDNIRLVKMDDVKYLVKNSLSVDAACDSNPNDNLPGAALGCTEYQTTGGDSRYLTNFSYLCREGAIGCTALLNTQNTLDTDQSKVFNLWVPTGRMTALRNLLGLSDTDKDPCTIATGAAGCYTTDPIVGKTPTALRAVGGVFNASTIFIPADTATSTPMYLVASKTDDFNPYCNSSAIGCMTAGAVTQGVNGAQFVTTTIQNNPSQYVSATTDKPSILCQIESEGCDAFTSKLGNTYFKDPIFTNAKICAYSDVLNSSGYKGWFWKDVGTCVNNHSQYCSFDSDCPGSTCDSETKNTIPCYPNYLQSGTTYGLWSSGNKEKYQNYVGECPAAQDSCKEFVDHNDSNRPYYLIANEKLSQGDCDNGVSRKYGCILLDDTGQPNKFWGSSDTYRASEQKNFEKVAPVSTGYLDSNVIAKVKRDRECEEWLYPNQIHPDSQGVNKSYGLGVCDKAQSGTGFISQCAEDITAKWQGKGNYLDVKKYVQRSTSWTDVEYSGFSLFNSYQIADLEPLQDPTDPNNYVLVYKDNCIVTQSDPHKCDKPAGCLNELGADGTARCGLDNNHDGALDGWCVKQQCVYPANGISDKQAATLFNPSQKLEALACRAYPEVDSPYPKSIITSAPDQTPLTYVKDFENVKVCSGDKCECSYKKVVYGVNNEATLYYGLLESPTSTVTNSSEPTKPYTPTKISTYNGGWGYCVERDIRRQLNGDTKQNTCLTWYPVDVPLGVADISASAGSQNYAYNLPGSDTDRYICIRNRPTVENAFATRGMSYAIGLGIHNVGAPDENGNQAQENYDQASGCGTNGLNDFNLSDAAGSSYKDWAKTYDLPYVTQLVSAGCDAPYNTRTGIEEIRNDSAVYIQENFSMSSSAGTDKRVSYKPITKFGVLGAGHAGNFKRQEIRQIDVFFTGSQAVPGGSSNVVSFFPLAQADAGTEFTKKWVAYLDLPVPAGSPPGTINRGHYSEDVDSIPSSNGSLKLHYMRWSANGTADSWYSGSGSGDYMKNLNSETDISGGTDSTDVGATIYFDDSDSLRGISVGMWDGAGGDTSVGYFFVFHLTNGQCEWVAKVNNTQQYFVSKPITWRLAQNKVGLNLAVGSSNIGHVYDRKQNYTFLDYGLIKSHFTPGNSPLWINPLNYDHADNMLYQPDTEFRPGYLFDGGEPLVYYHATAHGAGQAAENISDLRFDCKTGPGLRKLSTDAFCASLDHFFAKVYDFWKLNVNGTAYVKTPPVAGVTQVDAAAPDFAYPHYPPKIAAVDYSCANVSDSTGCGMATLNRFSVNGTYNDDVFIGSNDSVTLSFFAWADGAQMPLRRVKIDLDNGLSPYVSESTGGISNYKWNCSSSSHCRLDPNIPCNSAADCQKVTGAGNVCDPNKPDDINDRNGFGNTTQTGCVESYYKVYGNYTCDAKVLYHSDAKRYIWDEVTAGDKKYNPDAHNGGHLAVMRTNPDMSVDANGNRNKPWELLLTATAISQNLLDGSVVCAYNPRVQVMDNWGWCSGKCSKVWSGGLAGHWDNSENNLTAGCYQDWGDNRRQQCDGDGAENIYAWVPFYNSDPAVNMKTNVIIIPSSD